MFLFVLALRRNETAQLLLPKPCLLASRLMPPRRFPRPGIAEETAACLWRESSANPDRKEEAANRVGCFWRKGYCGGSFVVPAAHTAVVRVVTHFYAEASFEISCRSTFEACLAVFFARRRRLT